MAGRHFESIESRTNDIVEGLFLIADMLTNGAGLMETYKSPAVVALMGSPATARRYWLEANNLPRERWSEMVRNILTASGRSKPRERLHLGPVAESIVASVNIYDPSISVTTLYGRVLMLARDAGESMPSDRWFQREIRRRRGFSS